LIFYTPIIRSYLRKITNFYSIIPYFDEVMPYALTRLRKSLIALLIIVCGK